uniref:DRBM domain-containing protein n=1 Tax=Plectus sambesii TaxID=2011161 RepID=A0A914XPW0_9BILA
MRGRKVSPLQVAVNGQKCQGAGPNKKLAKRAAAEAMLDILGYNKPMPMPGKSLLKKKSFQAVETCDAIEESTADKPNISDSTSDNQTEKVETLPKQTTESDGELPDMEPHTRQRRVTFSNEISACPPPDNSMFDFSSGGGKIPGLLFVNKPKRRSKDLKKPLTQRQQQLVADMAKEFLDGQTRNNNEPEIGVFCVPSAASAAPSTLLDRQPAQTAPQSVASVSSAKEKLEYLAGLLKFSVSFTDFPKTTRDDGSGDQHFSLVTLGVSPPQVCHGGGKTESEAQETASLNALRALAERKPDRSANRNRESFDDSESLNADDAACADGNEEFDDSSLAEEIVERKRPTEPL